MVSKTSEANAVFSALHQLSCKKNLVQEMVHRVLNQQIFCWLLFRFLKKEDMLKPQIVIQIAPKNLKWSSKRENQTLYKTIIGGRDHLKRNQKMVIRRQD